MTCHRATAEMDPQIGALYEALAELRNTRIQALPPWNAPPASFESFDPHAYVALPAIGTETAVVEFMVPNGRNGLIDRVGNVYIGGGWTEGSGDLLWRIERDGASFPNYENIVASLGAVLNPSKISGLRVNSGEVIRLIVRNTNIVVAGQLAGGRLGGWFYPISDEEPFIGY